MTLTVAWDSKQWDLKAHNHAGIRNKNWKTAHAGTGHTHEIKGEETNKSQEAGKAEGRITLPKIYLLRTAQNEIGNKNKIHGPLSEYFDDCSQNDPVGIPQHQTTPWEERKTTT